MTNVELLPLPPARLVIKHDRGPISETEPFWNKRDVSDYARACVTHATAAKDAEIARLNEAFDARERMLADIEQARAVEIEALRAERDSLERSLVDAMAEVAKLDATEARAEQLAEALQDATTMLLVDYPATAKRLRAVITAAQENDDVQDA